MTLDFCLGGFADETDAAFAAGGAVNGLGHERGGAGADDEIEGREGAEEVVGHALGHAAHDADDAARALAFGGAEEAEFAEGLVLGLGADAAGVDDDDVGGVLVGGAGVAARLQQGADGLAVAHVHLAAVGVDVEEHRRGFRFGGTG